jgi:predicted ribosome quality control (RQC) complex YloA/Tae2 family protein
MDNFLLQAIITELEPTITGHRLGKIYQLGATDLLIDLHLRDDRRLAVSTDPQRLALYLTTRSPKQFNEAPRTDTAFVSLLKKHLHGSRIVSIEKLGYDRVVKFDFVCESEKRLTLVVMLTGRAADVLLLEKSQVIASLREREEPISTYLDPPPPPDKLDPFLCPVDQLDELIAECSGDVAEAAQKHLIGFAPIYALELAFRAGYRKPSDALQGLLKSIFESPAPAIYSSGSIDDLRREIGRDDFALTLSPIELTHLSDQVRTTFPTVNESADAYFSLLDERRRFLAIKQRIGSHLAAKIKKQKALVANLQRELASFANAGAHQRYGELLLANLHQFVKSESGFIVTDFYDETQPKIEIPSADKPSPQDAAEHYFKLARKARHGTETINARLPEIERELAKLETEKKRLESIKRIEELDALAISVGLTSAPQQKQSSRPAKKIREEKISGVRRYRSSDGFEILVGRTDRDNDNLTFRVAKSHDLWFHAADYPGSHVVLRNPQRKQVPPRAITEAAQLAAKFSQAKGGAKVAVNYCERKFVTKMKGFAPGQVRLSSFKTAMVEPGETGERVL